MNYTFLINPCAGSGKGHNVWHEVKHYLDKKHIPYQAIYSQHTGQPRTLASKLANNHSQDSCLVVIGGDGTLHEAITGLMVTNQVHPLPVAYIPAGTGNDFARGYGISFEPLTALKQILNNNHIHWINIGHYVNHSTNQTGIFLNNIGIGFDAAIVEHTVNSKLKKFLNKHHLGTLSYALKTIKVLLTQPSFSIQVSTAERTYNFPKAFLVVTSNHPYIGGGVKIAADQHIDEEQIELAVLEKQHLLSFWWSIIMFATGNLIHCHAAHLFRQQKISYKAFSKQYGQTDGELLGKTDFDLDITCSRYPFWQISH